MIHAEWRVSAPDEGVEEIEKADVPSETAAFMLANDLLFVEESTDKVTVWLSGVRSVPVHLTRANITHHAQAWLKDRDRDKLGHPDVVDRRLGRHPR